jgi:hypothetical protein
MKRISLLVTLILFFNTGYSQEYPAKTKAEIKTELIANRKADKIEQQRIKDSIYQAKQIEYEKAFKNRMLRKNATSLLIITTFESPIEVFDALIHAMRKTGVTIASIDKDYYIIKTTIKSIGGSPYQSTYEVFLDCGKVCARATSIAYDSLTIGTDFVRSNLAMYQPIRYKGDSAKSSLVSVVWNEMESLLLSIPHIEAKYIK